MNPVSDTKFDLKQHIAAWYIIFMLNMLHIFIGNVLHIPTQLLGGIFMAGFCAALLLIPCRKGNKPEKFAYNARVYFFFLIVSLPYLLFNTEYEPSGYLSAYIRVIGVISMFYAVRFFKGPAMQTLICRVCVATLLLQFAALVIFLIDPSVSQFLFYIERKAELETIDFVTRFSGTVGEINILPYLCLFSAAVLVSPQVSETHLWLKKTVVRIGIFVPTAACVLLSGSRGGALAALLLFIYAIRRRKKLLPVVLFLLLLGGMIWHFAGPALLSTTSEYLGDNNLFVRIFGQDSREAEMAEVSSELRWTMVMDYLAYFLENPFAVHGVFFANCFAFGPALPHCGPVYLLFSYGILGLYPIYVLVVGNFFIARRKKSFYIYLVMLPLLLLSVDSFYYFVLPWMSIGLEKLASCRAPEEDVTTRTESRPGGKE